MSDDQFTRLFKYMEKNFAEVRSDTAALESKMNQRFDHVYSTLDTLLKQQETDSQERLAMLTQLSRHDARLQNLEAKTR